MAAGDDIGEEMNPVHRAPGCDVVVVAEFTVPRPGRCRGTGGADIRNACVRACARRPHSRPSDRSTARAHHQVIAGQARPDEVVRVQQLERASPFASRPENLAPTPWLLPRSTAM